LRVPRIKRSARPGPLGICVEAALWLTTACCLWFGFHSLLLVHAAQQEASKIVVQPKAADEREVEGQDDPTPHAGALIGRMDIAALGLSVPVLEDDDPATLRRGAGHIPGTAVPGGLGNLVLAAHRDTFFRALRNVRPGMKVEVTTPDGHWWYSIDRTEIVTPDRVDLLGIGDRPEMTLVTCYPFDYIGAAPKRFLVHANLLSAAPS
jgi:sortase A